jgi:Flp pilus assembly protein TadG
MLRKNSRRRSGAALVEMAIIMPVVVLLIFGLIVGGMGIFRYQEVANLAREGARYAAVHGTQYALENPGKTAATAQDIYNNAILPQAGALNTSKLTYSVTWNKTNSPVSATNDYEKPTGNTVTVTVTYTWMPEWFLVGPINLSSSSTVPMSY